MSETEKRFEALYDELERLREERDDSLSKWSNILAYEEELARLRRIKEAMERVLEKATKHDDGDIEAIARTALEEA